jgi:hypothetical protein
MARLERFDGPNLPPGFVMPHTPNLAMIIVNGCAANWPFGVQWGHSHIPRSGFEPFNVVCIREREWCFDPNDTTRSTPSKLLLHELAHIATGQGHTQTWARWLLSIGGVLDPEYAVLPMIDQR